MARIAGVDLPRNKHTRIALTYIYGIGQPRAASICQAANVEAEKKVQDLQTALDARDNGPAPRALMSYRSSATH